MKRIALDIETKSDWQFSTPEQTSLGLAVTFDGKRYQTWFTKGELCAYLRRQVKLGAKLIGHNAIAFDLVVLGCPELAHATIDTMIDAREQTTERGKGLSTLNTLAQHTLGKCKIDVSGDGGASGLCDRGCNGDRDALMLCLTYCKQDVLLTWELYQHGVKHGYIVTEGCQRINVNYNR